MSGELDFSKLLGFESIGEQIYGSVDFQDATLSAKLGAKVGDAPGGQLIDRRTDDSNKL